MMENAMSGFEDLLQQTDHLTTLMDTGSELPRVERNLHQIKEAAQRMAVIGSRPSQDTADVRAAILLGSKGLEIGKISRKLEGLASTQTFEPLEPVGDTDIQGFLKNERENALLAVIEQTRKHTFDEMQSRHWENLENEWEREKQKILNGLTALGQETLDLTQNTSILPSDSTSANSRSTMDNVEMAYARQVYIYNDHVLQGGVIPNPVKLFTEATKSMDDKNVTELWSMVSYMTDVVSTASVNCTQARTSDDMQNKFVQQAMKYLENSYLKHIQTTVYSNLQQAQLGGIPGTYHLVSSYLNVKLQGSNTSCDFQDGLVEGHPVWAMLYYCLRCGDLQAVLEVVDSAQQHLGEFPIHVREFIKSDERRLSHNSETKLRLHYRRSVRNSPDPYKRAVYCIIGRCDAKDDHSEIADKIDDYLWIKLSQLSDNVEDRDTMTLSELQTTLLEQYGESHFSAYQQPFLYFQVLFLTAQFEAAIEFMCRIERFRSHGIHVALALHEAGLLLYTPTIQAQILVSGEDDPPSLRRINFARLIMMYTRKFECTDPREALLYFYFLRNMKTVSGDNVFMSCVSELVLESREFDMLLGQLGRDGTRRPGAIDKFHADTQKIIEQVAKDTEQRGLSEDAVKLYDLAKSYDKVLELLNKLLTPVLAQVSTAQSNRDRIKTLATSVAQRYRTHALAVSEYNSTTFYLLLDLLTFFDLYHQEKVDQAYQVMQELKLLPLNSEMVEQKVNAFKSYSDEVRRSLPDILLAVMNILLIQYKKTKTVGSPGSSSMQPTPNKQSYVTYLREQSRALITFAGMIPYRMPGDTNARLVKIGVLMN